MECLSLKSEPWRLRIVVGGDKLYHKLYADSNADSLFETKLLINSVIYDARRGASFMSLDIKYLPWPCN